jgi:hypothetical protein
MAVALRRSAAAGDQRSAISCGGVAGRRAGEQLRRRGRSGRRAVRGVTMEVPLPDQRRGGRMERAVCAPAAAARGSERRDRPGLVIGLLVGRERSGCGGCCGIRRGRARGNGAKQRAARPGAHHARALAPHFAGQAAGPESAPAPPCGKRTCTHPLSAPSRTTPHAPDRPTPNTRTPGPPQYLGNLAPVAPPPRPRPPATSRLTSAAAPRRRAGMAQLVSLGAGTRSRAKSRANRGLRRRGAIAGMWVRLRRPPGGTGGSRAPRRDPHAAH